MKHKLVPILLAVVMLFSCTAYADQMEEGVPVWTEETVRQYLLDYIEGSSMDRLWGYFDLQIRRYMPMETYTAMLSDLEFLTGDFVELGAYSCFEEPEFQTKTHVVHMIMEKQDLDVYFTHKNQEDDWEIMALEFALADEVDPSEADAEPAVQPSTAPSAEPESNEETSEDDAP